MSIQELAANTLHKLKFMHNKGVLLGVAVAVTALVPLGFVQQANAAASDCYNGIRLCFWVDPNFSGLRTDYYSPSSGCHNVSSTFNDKISSMVNQTPHRVYFYIDSNCSGGYAPSIPPFYQSADVGSWGYNDKISSFYVN